MKRQENRSWLMYTVIIIAKSSYKFFHFVSVFLKSFPVTAFLSIFFFFGISVVCLQAITNSFRFSLFLY